jgi:REP element-mobilizing transposase RayT
MARHKHLRRLDTVWIEPAIYFVTICANGRRPILANESAHAILREELAAAPQRHGWSVGRYVVMPDHLHFFCAGVSTLSQFAGAFKEWTAKRLTASGAAAPIWQREFFDHLLRSNESYADKWTYVRENPVRGGLVSRAADWPYAGEIERLER